MTVLSLWKGPLRARPSMTAVATEIAERHGVTLAEMKGPCRVKRLCEARLEAYAALWDKGDLSRSANIVGRFLGGRDHSTVIKGANAYLARLEARERAAA